MKFGSLRATGRDGQLREFPIDLPALTIGRADDNGIVIEDASISPRHARIVIESGRMLVEDLGSEWGTFLDGQRLAPRTRHLVEPGQALRFGEVEARYAEPGGPTVPSAQGAAATAAAAMPVTPGIRSEFPAAPSTPAGASRATLVTPPGPITPGEAAFGTIAVENRGRVVDQLRVAVTGVPVEWVSVSVPALALLPGARQEVGFRIQPPRRPDSAAGDYNCMVIVSSEAQEQQTSLPIPIRVMPFEAVVLALQPVQGTRNFRLTGRNDGNTTAIFSLSGTDDAAALEYRFGEPTLEVPPGEERTVQVQVRSTERPFVGQRQVVAFKLVATPTTPGKAKKEASGQLMVKPPLRSLKPLALLGIVALGLAGAAALFALRGDGGTPESPTASAAAPTPTPNASAVEAIFKCPDDPSPATPPAGPQVELPALAAQLFAQNDDRWGRETYAKANDPRDVCGATIAQCGCAMTSLTNVLAIFGLLVMPDGQLVNPKTVNDYFNQDARRLAGGWVSRGYSFNNVQWDAITELSKKLAEAYPGTKRIAFVPAWGTGSEDEIRRELRGGRPVILELYINVPGYQGPHFIFAYGLAGDTILVKDPSHPEQRTLDAYLGTIQSSRLFREVEPGEDLSAIVVTAPANLRVTITDSKGRVVGTLKGGKAEDSVKDARVDIPGAMYTFQPAWRDPTCTEKAPQPGTGTVQIYLPRPADGKYRINVQDPNGGATSVGVRTYDPDGNAGLTGQDNPGPTELVIDVSRPKTPTPAATTAPQATVGRTPSPPTATFTPAPTGTSTSTPSPTLTSTPTPPIPTPTSGLSAPSTASVSCGGVADAVASGYDVTISCRGSVTGTWTHMNWKLDGDLLEKHSNGKVLSLEYTFHTTQLKFYFVEFEACNRTACITARSDTIRIR